MPVFQSKSHLLLQRYRGDRCKEKEAYLPGLIVQVSLSGFALLNQVEVSAAPAVIWNQELEAVKTLRCTVVPMRKSASEFMKEKAHTHGK